MDKEKIIDEILTRSVEKIVDVDNLKKRLLSGEILRIKLGIDPTSPDVHLGRTVPLLKLRAFQKLGHQIVFIVGDFTALIGDTSDKESERPMLSKDQVITNLQTYIDQVSKILDISKTEVVYNSHWLSKLTYEEIGEQADLFSVNDFIARSNIKDRLDNGGRVSLREVLYPIMQGYDSVVVRADVEIGGNDQWFNLLAGRKMQKHYQQLPQDIITLKLVEGLDGRKMSSSWGNTINLTDGPNDMFGKLMTVKDELIIPYFEHFTDLSLDDVNQYKNDLLNKNNPREIKEIMAFEITKFYWSETKAQEARDYFNTVFRDKILPEEIIEYRVDDFNIINILLSTNLVDSKTEARRVIDQGGIKVNDLVVNDYDFIVDPGSVIKKGKRQIIKVIS